MRRLKKDLPDPDGSGHHIFITSKSLSCTLLQERPNKYRSTKIIALNNFKLNYIDFCDI